MCEAAKDYSDFSSLFAALVFHGICISTREFMSFKARQELRRKEDMHNYLRTGLIGLADHEADVQIEELIDPLAEAIGEDTIFCFPEGVSDADTILQVLVVDNSYSVRRYMEHKLTELTSVPIRISFAATGEEAMTKLETKFYDMVIVDIVMEGVDGYKVEKAIKNHRPSHVVILTSEKSSLDNASGAISGCDSIISKPPSDQQLIDEIEKGIKIKTGKQADFSDAEAALAF